MIFMGYVRFREGASWKIPLPHSEEQWLQSIPAPLLQNRPWWSSLMALDLSEDRPSKHQFRGLRRQFPPKKKHSHLREMLGTYEFHYWMSVVRLVLGMVNLNFIHIAISIAPRSWRGFSCSTTAPHLLVYHVFWEDLNTWRGLTNGYFLVCKLVASREEKS